MKYFSLICVLVFSTWGLLHGQNRYNSEGERTGKWKVYYPEDSVLRYEATFRDGNPVGRMTRYDRKGRLDATMEFYPGTDRCYVTMYSDNGAVSAKGVYDQQSKDSTWQYLGRNGTVRMVEEYDHGKLDGTTRSFYPSGKISRKISYSDGNKDGPWIQFFENGDTMLVTNYTQDMLNGNYHSYYPGGDIQISGSYYHDQKDGDWKYYSEEGEILTVLRFDRGMLLNPEELAKSYESFIEQIEENAGNIPDPALEGFH